MKIKVEARGGGLGLRIPSALAQRACIEEGMEVDVTVEHGCLIVRPLGPGFHELESLLRGITSANRHPAVETGRPVGREIW